MKTHRLIPLVFLILFLLSCMRPRLNVDTETLSTQPTPISGSCNKDECDEGPSPTPPPGPGNDKVTALNMANALVQCRFMADPTPTSYQAECQAYVWQQDGSTLPAKSLESGVEVRWKEPRCVNGIEIDEMNCEQDPGGLFMQCQIDLDVKEDESNGKGKNPGSSQMAIMEFTLEIEQKGVGSRVEVGLLEP